MTNVPKQIVEKVLAARAALKPLTYDAENPHGGYAYASIDAYYTKIATKVTEVGLLWRGRETEFSLLEHQGKNKDRTWVKVKIVYDLMVAEHTAPDWMTVTILQPVDGAQTTGQVYSYADKVFMRVAFCVATGEADSDSTKSEPLGGSTVVTGGKVVVDDILQTMDTTPRDAKGNPLKGDAQTGEIMGDNDLLSDAEKALVSGFKGGLPSVDTRKVTPEAVSTIELTFKTFLPMAKTKSQLNDFHAENFATIEKIKTLDPASHDRIKAMFNARNKELTKGTK